MVAIDGHGLHIAKVITYLASWNSPPEGVTGVYIMAVTLGGREAEKDFRRVFIIPVENLIPRRL